MWWHRSANSTSLTLLSTHPREVLDLSLLAIISSIHSALIAKSYQSISKLDPASLESLGERLLERVQCEVRALTRGPYLDRIDWEVRIFRPMIATFHIHEDLGICEGDSEYIFLLATVLMLAYELLYMAGKSNASNTRSFLSWAFSEYFNEPEICSKVVEVLDSERKRLAEGSADVKVLRAIQDISGLLPNIEICTAAWNASMYPRRKVLDGAVHRIECTLASQTTPWHAPRWSNETTATAKSRKWRKRISFASPQLPVPEPEVYTLECSSSPVALGHSTLSLPSSFAITS